MCWGAASSSTSERPMMPFGGRVETADTKRCAEFHSLNQNTSRTLPASRTGRALGQATSAFLEDEGLGLDRCFFVVGRLVLMHRIVSQCENPARKSPPSPRASHVSTSHPHPHPGEPRGVVFRAGPAVFLATPLGKHAYKRGRGVEHAAEACPARARSRCVTPSQHWSPAPHRHSSGRRAGWPHIAYPLQLDHILNRPGKNRESRAKGSHPSNASGAGRGWVLGGRELLNQ